MRWLFTVLVCAVNVGCGAPSPPAPPPNPAATTSAQGAAPRTQPSSKPLSPKPRSAAQPSGEAELGTHVRVRPIAARIRSAAGRPRGRRRCPGSDTTLRLELRRLAAMRQRRGLRSRLEMSSTPQRRADGPLRHLLRPATGPHLRSDPLRRRRRLLLRPSQPSRELRRRLHLQRERAGLRVRQQRRLRTASVLPQCRRLSLRRQLPRRAWLLWRSTLPRGFRLQVRQMRPLRGRGDAWPGLL